MDQAFELLWPNLQDQLKQITDSDQEDAGALSDNIPSESRRLTLLVESLSARILAWEDRAFGSRDSFRKTEFSPPELRQAVRQELEEVDARLGQLDLFDKVSELLRQADFRLEKQPEAALPLYEQATELDSTSIAARVGLAKAHRRLKNSERAISILTDVLKKDPSAERALYNRACYKNISHIYSLKEVFFDLEKAIELRPSYREYAMIDADFESIRTEDDFIRICEQ